MTNRNRPIVRTPKRRKVWAQFNESLVLGTGTSTPKAIDMLEAYYSDLGAGQQGGLTVMRIVGSFQLTDWTAGDATPMYQDIRFGVTWLDKNISDAADGDGNIPEALQDGVREHVWIQQWKLSALEQDSADVNVGRPAQPQVENISFIHVDVTQMRKQPTAASKLSLCVSGGSSWGANTVILETELSILLALP